MNDPWPPGPQYPSGVSDPQYPAVNMERTHLKATATKDGTMTIAEMKPVATTRTTCRSCLHKSLEPVLSLGEQYLVGFVKDPDPSLPRAPLEFVRCGGCGLLQLAHTVDPERLYREFWYRSSVNETMRTALSDIVRTGLTHHHEGTWLDIGANDGYLLSQVPSTFKRIACEPALNFREDLEKVADHVIADFFTAEHEFLRTPSGENFRTHDGACDVITSAAMFYDLDDPNAFVADIAKVLAPGGVWINQLNDSPTMLRSNAFDAICHEHLCYYDLPALESLYRRHGLSILSVSYNDVNGGSVRVTAERPAALGRAVNIHGFKRATEIDAIMFASRVGKWRQRFGDMLTGPLAKSGGLWCYGASTKGCVLLQYLDMPGTFHAIADRNPVKFGLHMTGTWLPVQGEAAMRKDKPDHVVVLPWAFKNEFVARERAMLDEGTTMVFPLPSIECVL